MRHPGVDRHVREDPGPVEESGLRADEEERPLGDERQEEEASRERTRPEGLRREPLRQDGVERPARDPVHPGEEVAEDQPPRREGERDGHVEHRPAPRPDARLAQDLEPVRDRLDPRVRASAHREGLQEEGERPDAPEGGPRLARFARRRGDDLGHRPGVAADSEHDQEDVRHEEEEEYGQEEENGLLHAAQVQDDQQDDEDERDEELLSLRDGPRREGAESRDRGSDLHRDRHRVVDDERRAGHDAGSLPEEARRDEVAAASRREEGNDLGVRRRDDGDRHRHRDGKEDREVRMGAEGDERLLGAVARGGEAVRPEADPGEERGQGEVVEDLRVEGVTALADDELPGGLEERHVQPLTLLTGRALPEGLWRPAKRPRTPSLAFP